MTTNFSLNGKKFPIDHGTSKEVSLSKTTRNKASLLKVTKLPSNLGVSRSITPSKGIFYSSDSKNTSDKKPLKIEEVTQLGTISSLKDVTTTEGKDVNNANIQKIDVCYLPVDHDTVSLEFTLAFCSESLAPHSCNCPVFRKKMTDFTGAYKDIGGYKHIARLYLDNIIAAKMLWRNSLADDITVSIQALRTNLGVITSTSSELYDSLVSEVGAALAGDRRRIVLDVKISGWLGSGQEVYPSQEYVNLKYVKGEKSKTLARSNIGIITDIASMHPQKIGNAVRQIDTWYEGFAELQKALPIDPACVSKSEFKVYRPTTSKRDLYSLLNRSIAPFTVELLEAKNIDSINPDIHFVIGNLIRGGVFGGKEE